MRQDAGTLNYELERLTHVTAASEIHDWSAALPKSLSLQELSDSDAWSRGWPDVLWPGVGSR